MIHSEFDSTSGVFTIPVTLKKGGVANRILVKPKPKDVEVLESGLQLPPGSKLICDSGVVISCDEGSAVNVGDKVDYKVVTRFDGSDAPVYIDNEPYVVLFEHDLWAVNDIPFNRVYVRPISSTMAIGEDGGLIIPVNTKSYVQHGIIIAAPVNNDDFHVGDVVSYRTNEQGMFPEVIDSNGDKYNVLRTTDVYTINREAAPNKMIVKINVLEQMKMRMIDDTQLQVHPAFAYMKHYLQYGKIVSAGYKALMAYDGIDVGDYVVIHHSIEHQDFRLLSEKSNSKGIVVSEERILDCVKDNSREIFGKIVFDADANGKRVPANGISHIDPVNGNIFLDYQITPFESITQKEPEEMLERVGFDLSKVRTVDELVFLVDNAKKRGVTTYTEDFNQMKEILRVLNPEVPKDKNEIDLIETKIELLRRNAELTAGRIGKNHLMVCKLSNYSLRDLSLGEQEHAHIVTQSSQLYPIKVMGKRFLIAHSSFIKARLTHNCKTTENMEIKVGEFTPFADLVLVQPIGDTQLKDSSLILPSTATFEAPTYGVIISVGPGTDKVKMVVKKDTKVVYRKGVGEPIHLDGVDYLLLRQDDLLLGKLD